MTTATMKPTRNTHTAPEPLRVSPRRCLQVLTRGQRTTRKPTKTGLRQQRGDNISGGGVEQWTTRGDRDENGEEGDGDRGTMTNKG